MAFVKTESYFRNKIENIKKAIIGTEKTLQNTKSQIIADAEKRMNLISNPAKKTLQRHALNLRNGAMNTNEREALYHRK